MISEKLKSIVENADSVTGLLDIMGEIDNVEKSLEIANGQIEQLAGENESLKAERQELFNRLTLLQTEKVEDEEEEPEKTPDEILDELFS